MKLTREYHVCDRCGEELLDQPIIRTDPPYIYELCVDCDERFLKYKKDINELNRKYDEVQQYYGFGKYINNEEDEK